ncbi:MAG: hypothetical protein HQ591_02520 [candidate division Zixibacteria bacterium]|nr:hypothetical protein [Candidatus Tariuqbacter arcticus]
MSQDSAEKPPVILERAKILKNRIMGGETVKELIDDVRITRGDMTIDCDYAIHFQETDKIVFEQNVHYSDSLRDLWADRVIYFIENDSLEAIGSVKIIQDMYEAHCSQANYTDQRKNVYLYRDVELFHHQENIILTGEQGFGDRTLKYAEVFKNAQMVKFDSLGETEITITAHKIAYFNPESRAQASDSVEILKDEVTGNCEILQYFTEEDYALMEVEPVVFRELDEIKGDSIYLYFVEEKIEHIEIFGHASVFSPPEGGQEGDFNKMFGNRIFIYLLEGQIEKIDVAGNARSLYYLYEKEEFKGVNQATGDKIYLRFAQGKIETINVAGGSEGTYYPPDYPGIIE